MHRGMGRFLTFAATAVLLGFLPPGQALADRARLQVSATVVRSTRVELTTFQVDARSLEVTTPGVFTVEQRDAQGRTALARDPATGAWRLSPDTTAVVVTVMADAS